MSTTQKWRICAYVLGGYVLQSPNGNMVRASDSPYLCRYKSVGAACRDITALDGDPYYCDAKHGAVRSVAA